MHFLINIFLLFFTLSLCAYAEKNPFPMQKPQTEATASFLDAGPFSFSSAGLSHQHLTISAPETITLLKADYSAGTTRDTQQSFFPEHFESASFLALHETAGYTVAVTASSTATEAFADENVSDYRFLAAVKVVGNKRHQLRLGVAAANHDIVPDTRVLPLPLYSYTGEKFSFDMKQQIAARYRLTPAQTVSLSITPGGKSTELRYEHTLSPVTLSAGYRKADLEIKRSESIPSRSYYLRTKTLFAGAARTFANGWKLSAELGYMAEGDVSYGHSGTHHLLHHPLKSGISGTLSVSAPF